MLEATASEELAREAPSFKSRGRCPEPVNCDVAPSVCAAAVDVCSSVITLSSTDKLVTWRAERERLVFLELHQQTHVHIIMMTTMNPHSTKAQTVCNALQCQTSGLGHLGLTLPPG